MVPLLATPNLRGNTSLSASPAVSFDLWAQALRVLAKHLHRIDGNKDALTAGQDRAIEGADFSSMKMLATLDFYGPSNGAHFGCQGNGLEIVNRHMAGERDDTFP